VSSGASAPASTIHPDLADVFRGLEDAGIGWLHLRGMLDGSDDDVDLLVDPDRVAALTSVVTARGFVQRRAPEHAPHLFFVRYLPAEGRWLVLDVLPAVVPAGVGSGELAISARLIARSAVDTQGVRRPDETDGIWLMILRRALQRGAAGVREWVASSSANMSGLKADGPVAQSLDTIVGSGTAARFLSSFEESDDAFKQATDAIAARLRRTAKPRSALGRQLRRVRVALPWGAEGKRGITVAVLGPDGAGKSTLIDGLVSDIPLGVTTHYLGVFRTTEREAFWRKVPGVTLGLKLVKLRTRSSRGAYSARLGHVALFDRHAVDALLRPGPKTFKSTVSYSLLSHSCAKPDTFVVLDAPGEVMFARKGEHDVETLEERRQRYLDLQDRYPNVAVVDATQSADDVLRDVSALIWSLYSAPPS